MCQRNRTRKVRFQWKSKEIGDWIPNVVNTGIINLIYQVSLWQIYHLKSFLCLWMISTEKSLHTPRILKIMHWWEIVRRNSFWMRQETEKHRINIVQIWNKWAVIQFCLGSPGQDQDEEQMSLKGKSYIWYRSGKKQSYMIEKNSTETTQFPNVFLKVN